MNIENLQSWYRTYHRKLPFRETKNPYYIWISEIMLQQTQVTTVIPYFMRFIETYPTVFDLAKASEEALLASIQGLGYYRRFKLMLKASKIIVDQYNGAFPSTYKDVLALPGIGEYTAGAIMSIAYNLPFNATDGNVIRVISRIKDIEDDMRLEKNKKQIKEMNQSYIEQAEPNIYTQAIMELGALICKPKNPLCHQCPVIKDCMAYHKKKQNDLPYLSQKAKKKTVQYKTFIMIENNQLYLRKRTEQLLGGMYEFPQFIGEPQINYRINQSHGIVKHVFTHLIWEMDVYTVDLISEPLDDWVKIDLKDLSNIPMSNAHRKLIKYIG